MNPSLLIDIEKQLGQEQANNFISEMSRDPFEGIKNNVKSMFSHLRDEDITEILRKYNNNAEAAFEELMDRNNQIEENKKRERKLEEERKRMELNNRYVETMVRNFQMLDKKEIEEVFRNNNNDAQLTTNELYKMMKEREQKNEEAQKMKKQMEIQNMVSGFSEKFGEISKEELIRVIVSNDLNVEKITFELGKMQNQKIFDELFMQHYTVLSSEEIRLVCEESNWNKIEALKVLQGKRIEIELKKQIEVLKQNDVAIPKLEYSGQQLENLKQESHSKMIDVKKIIEIEEVKNEEETKKNIEKMIIENSQPEENAIKENLPASNECTIAVEIQESKIIATVDFKSMTNYSWIGFYAKEESNDKYKVYNYLCKLSDNKFSVDKPLINGSYNFRVFHQSYINVQTSEEIVLQKDDFVKMVRDEKNDKVINVSWQIGSVDPYAVSAYVTVHKKEEERANYYRRWNWIKTFNGTHTFKTPIHTGEYEARVYYNGKVQFRSETMKIEGI